MMDRVRDWFAPSRSKSVMPPAIRADFMRGNRGVVFGGWRPALREAKIDQEFVRAWVFGRRIWLGLGCLFHGILLVTMNIGMFPVIMMWFYPLFFEARPFLVVGRWLRDRLRRHKPTRLLAPSA